MLRKVLVTLGIVLVGLPAGFFVLEHFRGKRLLAKTIARLSAQNERLDIATIAPPPPIPASNGIDRLARVTERLNRTPQVYVPAMQCIAAGRAITSAKLEFWDTSRRGATNPWSAIESWVAGNEANLAEVRDALSLPECRATLIYSDGFKMLMPHLSNLKSACTALNISAALAAREGDFEAALADVEAMGRSASAIAAEPLAISQLVHVALLTITFNRAWDVLHSHSWNDEQLVRLDAALPRDNPLQTMVTSLEGERAIGLVTMRNMRATELAEFLDGLTGGIGGGSASFAFPDSFDAAADLADKMTSTLAASIRKYLFLPLWRFAFSDQAIAGYLDGMQELIDATRKDIREHRMGPAMPDGFPEETIPSTKLFDWSRNVFARTTIPTFHRALEKAYTADIQRTVLRTDIALQRYQRQHGRYPDSLEALVPDYLETVPVDLSDGKPVRYRLDPDGSPKLWSAGKDRVDDGGDGTQTDSHAPSRTHLWSRGQDWVWPQPASDDQAADWNATLRKYARGTPNAVGANGTAPNFQMSPSLMRRYGLLPTPQPNPTNPPPANP